MDLIKYPNYGHWLAVLARRNEGVLAIVAVAVTALLVLLEARVLWPRLYPALRTVGFTLYAAFFVLSLLLGGLAR